MVTTRSSTGSLPAKDGPSSKKTKRIKQNHSAGPAREGGPVIGENDKFSRLPYEILVMIWNHCRPSALLHLCRTNKAFRAYLTTRRVEAIWIAARQRMSVEAQASWPRPAGSSASHYGQPWPRTYALPEPPPYLNEISFAAFLFVANCHYCGAKDATKYYGTYHVACKTCEAGLKCRIDDLKAAYKDLDVDNRFYSILPHYLEDQYTRIFWKPTCDELQRDMAEFEASVGWNELALQSWITEKRKIINDHAQGKAVKTQVEIWKSARSHRRKLLRPERIERNTAIFLEYTKGTDLKPADLQDFCRVHKNATWVKTDAIIFNQKAALLALENGKDTLAAIRTFREEYEAAEKLKPVSDKILALITASLSSSVTASKTPWGFNHEMHMPDVLSLPVLSPIIQAIADGSNESDVSELWNTHWDRFCNEMIELEDEWIEVLLLLMVGAKQAEASRARDHINPVYTSFTCTNCKVRECLYYPSVFDHKCFCTQTDSPNLSDKSARDHTTRSVLLDLDGLAYDSQESEKLSKVVAALQNANQTVPTTRLDLYDLPGFFRCLDCAENRRRAMRWHAARDHICETTQFRELQEDGEWEIKSLKHLRLEYRPPPSATIH